MSIIALVLVAGVLGVAWWRGWSIVQGLSVAMVAGFVVSVASTGRFDLTVAGSPVVQDLAWRPAYLSLGAWSHWGTLLTTMFLHADAVHIVSNMIIFIFMGMGLEERIGRARLLAIFIGGGAAGTLLHSIGGPSGPESFIPVIGASGGVFAVIGAYATLFPLDKVVVFFFLILPNVPVYIASILYAAMELVALATIGQAGGVARIAHIGGIIGGVFIALVFMRHTKDLEKGPAGQTAAPPPKGVQGLAVLARNDEQRRLLDKLANNLDEPDIRSAWLERFAMATRCATCDEAVHVSRNGGLRCTKGHRFDYE